MKIWLVCLCLAGCAGAQDTVKNDGMTILHDVADLAGDAYLKVCRVDPFIAECVEMRAAIDRFAEYYTKANQELK